MQKDILIARLANAVDKIFVHMQSPDFNGNFSDRYEDYPQAHEIEDSPQTILDHPKTSAYLVPAAIIDEISSIMAGDEVNAGLEDYLTGDWQDESIAD